MVPPKPKSPTTARRAGLPTRSKAGCLTCKAKHLKCDETRPVCLRCSQKGIQCGGYWQGVRWSFKHQPDLASQTFQAQKYSQPPAPPAPPRATTNNRAPCPPAVSSNNNGAAMPSGTKVSGTPRKKQNHRSPSLVLSQYGDDGDDQVVGQAGFSQTILSTSHGSTSHGGPGGLGDLTSGRLTDKSSAFIIHWFENVCPAWSGFDSSSNPCRQIAIDLWQNSITVCSLLESMSAAFMASRNANMRQPALRLMKRATDYVQMELQIVRSQPLSQATPTSLLFSLFGLGTTVCWIDPRGLGLPFFKEARQLLNRLNQQQPTLPGAVDADKLAFFNKCMTYCNMLLAVVHDDEESDELICESIQNGCYGPLARLPGVDITGIQETPHPWTGISSLASHLFAESVKLCRIFRKNSRGRMNCQLFFSSPFQDSRAERLEEKLLDLEISTDTGTSDTGDCTTPPSHLALVAEAYRLASLLHLYQTFPNLVFLRLPDRSLPADDETVLWREWITPLSLHLIKVLGQIPPTSGSRVIQPLLYISASTGLRQQQQLPYYSSVSQTTFETAGPGFLQQAQHFMHTEEGEAESLSIQSPDHLSSYISLLMGGGNDVLTPAASVVEVGSDMSLDISTARHFIMRRLSILESSLPPTPVSVAKKLVSAIWRAYDSNPQGLLLVHWIDVMEANDLRSMFG